MKKAPKAGLRQLWIVQAYQYGLIDECEAPAAYETEAEAMAHAKDFASEVSWNSCEHECVVFKAIATFRGTIRVTKFESPVAIPPAERGGER